MLPHFPTLFVVEEWKQVAFLKAVETLTPLSSFCLTEALVAAIMSQYPLRVTVICMNSMNRNTEAHSMLQKKGFSIRSFGTGSYAWLPGYRAYDFATAYTQTYNDLLRRDEQLYTQTGFFHPLGRNERVKAHLERFQESGEPFDVIFTCEERVYDKGAEDLCCSERATLQLVHVIHVDMDDTEGATLKAFLICKLCQCLTIDGRCGWPHGRVAPGHGGENRQEFSSYGSGILRIIAGLAPPQ